MNRTDPGRRAMLAAVLAAACAFVAGANAQPAWPSRPIHLIVPFGAGGPPDVLARFFAQPMAEALGQPIVVENRTGAGGRIATEAASRSPADGYTLLVGSTTTLAIAPGLHAKLGYDASGFAPVGLMATAPFILFANADLGVASVQELIALAQARPRELVFASSGDGTPLHIAGEMFKSATGVDMVHVPYKDIGMAISDFLAGRSHIMFQQLAPLRRHMDAGKVRPLLVAAARRVPQLPQVPAAPEAGLHDFNVLSWFGIVAPRGTAPEIIARLNAELQKVLARAETRERLAALGFDPGSGSPAEFGAFIAAEIAKWSRALKASGMKPG